MDDDEIKRRAQAAAKHVLDNLDPQENGDRSGYAWMVRTGETALRAARDEGLMREGGA